MTTVEHVTGSGRARLDAASFADLVAVDGTEPASVRQRLRVNGLLTSRGTVPQDLEEVASAVRRPLCLLRVSVGGGAAALLHQAWLTDGAAALLLDLGDGRYDLFGAHPEAVPAAVARVTRLGPRKLTERMVLDADRANLEALWDPETDERRRLDALDRLGGAERRWVWRAEMLWPADALRPTGRSVTAMGGPEGWWLVRHEDGEDCTLIPTTPTALWLLLIGLMPTDEELVRIRAVVQPA